MILMIAIINNKIYCEMIMMYNIMGIVILVIVIVK